jgi:recombination protein RecA
LTKAGKIDLGAMRKRMNKIAGAEVAYDLNKQNPAEVSEWISTGSSWLDRIIKPGIVAGIPVGRFTEIAGLSGVGKSFMAIQIAANAQKMGIQVVYFDAESAVDTEFLSAHGIDTSEMIYVQAISVEKTFESIDAIMSDYPETKFLFIWDSLAATPTEKDLDYDPQSTMAFKARVMAKALPQMCVTLANRDSALVIVNQLKSNITSNRSEALTTPHIAPGGKALEYFSSVRIWLTSRKAKNSFVYDENNYRIGSETKATIKKSRFGSLGRSCHFKILWGCGNVGVADEDSWLDVLRECCSEERFRNAGAWYYLKDSKGKELKFQQKQWKKKLEDKEFKKAVVNAIDEALVTSFANKK